MSARPEPALEAVLDVVVELGDLVDHGTTRSGHRRVIPILGGTMRGLGRFASILPSAQIERGGADWQVVRPDGAIDVDTRYTARTPQGALIYLQTSGVRTGSAEILAALGRGEIVDPASYYFRLLVRFETSALDLQELEHGLFIASAARDAGRVTYTVYRVG
ncbi:DUF3237 family protein [Leifsonia xyli]|uniref:DUF3237 family protein n=1 Tax=Leifsonia xyli TaxID=1575 RepID=UPI003D664397